MESGAFKGICRGLPCNTSSLVLSKIRVERKEKGDWWDGDRGYQQEDNFILKQLIKYGEVLHMWLDK